MTKEIRIKIPAALHVKLHSTRLLKGKSISEAVTEALGVYFAGAPGRHGLPNSIAPNGEAIETGSESERHVERATG